jgi:hypothetical protein
MAADRTTTEQLKLNQILGLSCYLCGSYPVPVLEMSKNKIR